MDVMDAFDYGKIKVRNLKKFRDDGMVLSELLSGDQGLVNELTYLIREQELFSDNRQRALGFTPIKKAEASLEILKRKLQEARKLISKLDKEAVNVVISINES
ncbi:MAG: hypothetical protein KKH52_03380, partial [Nanoarchaeota archaeon]|nr:hypothetical protein [Nanoarchaeota archaeon]